MKRTNKKLGEILRESGLIDEIQLKSALSYQSQWGGRLGSIIIKLGFASEKEIISVLEKQYGLSCITIDVMTRPPDEVLNMIKIDQAKKYGIAPLRLEGKTLVVAAADPTDLKTFDDLSFVLATRIKPLLAIESDIMNAIGVFYEGKMPAEKRIVDKERLQEKMSEQVSSVLASGSNDHWIEGPPEIVRPAAEKETGASQKGKPELSQKVVVESIIDLLVAKGIFTREELIRQIKSKKSL